MLVTFLLGIASTKGKVILPASIACVIVAGSLIAGGVLEVVSKTPSQVTPTVQKSSEDRFNEILVDAKRGPSNYGDDWHKLNH